MLFKLITSASPGEPFAPATTIAITRHVHKSNLWKVKYGKSQHTLKGLQSLQGIPVQICQPIIYISIYGFKFYHDHSLMAISVITELWLDLEFLIPSIQVNNSSNKTKNKFPGCNTNTIDEHLKGRSHYSSEASPYNHCRLQIFWIKFIKAQEISQS